MGGRVFQIPVIFGTRPGKKNKYVWALNTLDMRVFCEYENKNIEELATMLDDWLGDAPETTAWQIITSEVSNRRCGAIIARLQKKWDDAKQ